VCINEIGERRSPYLLTVPAVSENVTRPTYLYHYTRAETLVRHILPGGSIRLSPFAETNDPRESKEWTFGLGSAVPWNGRQETSEEALATKVAAILRTTTKVLCLCADDERRTGYNTEELHYWGLRGVTSGITNYSRGELEVRGPFSRGGSFEVGLRRDDPPSDARSVRRSRDSPR
jgi:hypothetical protein